MNSKREFNVSLDGTLLSHTTNLNSSSYLPLCEFVQSEHRKTENIHFQFPFLMSWTSTFSLLIKVPIAFGWGRWSAGWDGGGGEEVRVNTLFKLWTIYFWLTPQFSTVQYIYVATWSVWWPNKRLWGMSRLYMVGQIIRGRREGRLAKRPSAAMSEEKRLPFAG